MFSSEYNLTYSMFNPQEWVFPLESEDYTLLILNQPLPSLSTFKLLWSNASFKICADGGANRLLDLSPEFNPNLIIGDLDSILPETLNHFSNVEVIRDPCQDTTDLEKSLNFIFEHEIGNKNIVVYGCFGGRLDCTLGSIHSCSKFSELNITLLSNENMGICLRPNTPHTIHRHAVQGDSVGLIPFSHNVKCKTTGLKWNIEKCMGFGFGNFISTSNTWDEESNLVTVESDKVVFFTTDLLWN